MSAEGTTRKRMGITAIISSIFIVATIVWSLYGFILIQSGAVRPYPSQYEYDLIKYWPYENGFQGGNTNWFDNLNYTNFPLNMPLPNDLLDHLNDTVFVVSPADPGQLWRTDSFDYYDGSGWSKTVEGTRPLNSNELISSTEANNQGNQVYVIFIYAEAGATTGSMSLPSLFPSIRVIQDSFHTWHLVDGTPVMDNPSRLLDYSLATDDYGTLLFSPFIDGDTGEQVLISYEITFVNQDLATVQSSALPGSAAFLPLYTDLTAVEPLTSRVMTEINQFTSVGTNAYEKAMAVQTYFQTHYNLTLTQDALTNRPSGQEVTDWFIENGGGLPMDFATAYCVFMRELGVPTRIVSGYALGDRNPVGDSRTVKVKHQTFWDEVYIPMSGASGGEWIQVIPTPLPDGYGGGEIPTNTPVPKIELLVFPTNGLPNENIGVPFNISATITVDGVYVATPETFLFYDESDTETIGTAVISQSITPPTAIVTYTFPSNATPDFHTINATWSNQYYSVWNATRIYASATPQPYRHSIGSSFIPASATLELNINQGLDTYNAMWTDTVHVYGVMTSGGNPINGSKYGNQYIQIIWDETVVGSAHIGEDGYYELNVYVNPMDHTLMTVGQHQIWSNYTGDYDPILHFWRLNPASSLYNSTVTVWGRVNVTLSASPTNAYGGAILEYDGTVQFLNGSQLPFGQGAGVFFGTSYNTTTALNTSSGFHWSFMIPLAQPDGIYFARANFTSPWPYIVGNWSISIQISVNSGGSQIILNPLLPNPMFIGQNVTISGYLQYAVNSSGIANQPIDIWWLTGSTMHLGQATTAADGYFEFSYVIPAGYVGPVTYWANYTSIVAGLSDTQSIRPTSLIKQYDTIISINVTPNPARLLETITVQGVVTLPENGSSPLASILVSFWWGNSTYPLGVQLDTTTTNATGGYTFYYQVPLSHNIETVDVWVAYTSLRPDVASNESIHEPLALDATNTYITINEDYTYYYLNESVYLYGHLQFDNGTPIVSQTVDIYWMSPDGTFLFQNTTDINGDYFYWVSLNPSMQPGTVNVHVNWTSSFTGFTDAINDLQPPIQLIQYTLEFTTDIPSRIYLDQSLYIQGILAFTGGTPPLSGATVYIANSNGTAYLVKAIVITNSTGGFNYTFLPSELDGMSGDFLLYYASGTNLISDAYALFSVNRIQYQVNLEITVLRNPVVQNGTVAIHAYLYFANNNTPLAFTDIDIYWYNGTIFPLGTITTDATGQANLYYSGMINDNVTTGIEVYGYYAGTALRSSNESVHVIVTLLQWQTQLLNVNTDNTQYRLTETVVVTGTLQFANGSIPYSGVTVELYLSGTPVDSTTSAGDGSFTLSWYVDPSTPLTDYVFEVRFTSSYTWIADTQFFLPAVTVYAPGYLWPSFTVAPESPTPLYILGDLNISGTVTWDNSTPYAFSVVTLYWGNPASTYYFIANVTTDGSGAFSYIFSVPAGTSLGTRDVWAYIPPLGYAAPGTSQTRTVLITTYSVAITTSVDVTTAHLGDQIVFSGTAAFSNGTPLDGYQIEIWWHGVLLNTATVTPAGTFSYTHTVPTSLSVGVKTGYAYFNAPSAAFVDSQVSFNDITVREYVYLYLNPEPSTTTFTRGQSFIVTGYVSNDFSQNVAGALISALMNGSSTGVTDTTGTAGTFSITVSIDRTTSRGTYIITVTSLGPYHDILYSGDSWVIQVFMSSNVHIQATSGYLMPGESISVLIGLDDEDGTPINGATINILLDTTTIGSVVLTSGSSTPFDITIPTTWSDNGAFAVSAEYTGGQYLSGDTAVSANSVNIFTDVVVVQGWSNRVDPGNAFTIQAVLNDPDGNPIIGRDVLLNLNGTIIGPLVTDTDGRITYAAPQSNVGRLALSITLTSNEVPYVVKGPYTILIQVQGGIILQGTDLIIAGILLIGAVIAVLAYLYIVKGMFHSVVISRGIDVPTKLRNIKKLADAGKYGASITLAYRTFEQMCGSKMGSERTHNETAREYLERVMQSIPLESATVEQFVQTYEEARFSHHEMTRDRYEAALRIFTDLYPRIDTGVTME